MSENAGFGDTATADSGESTEAVNPYAEQFESIQNRLGQLDSKLDERFPAQEQSGFVDQLYGEGNYEGLTDSEVDQYYADEPEDGFDDDGYGESGQEIVERMIAERLAPVEQAWAAQEQEQAFRQIESFQKQHPDLETDEGLRQSTLEYVQQIVGPDGDLLNPVAVEIAYKAAKADAVAAGEVPAESAAKDQAFLESGAGASQQDSDPDDEIREAIRRHSVGGDPF